MPSGMDARGMQHILEGSCCPCPYPLPLRAESTSQTRAYTLRAGMRRPHLDRPALQLTTDNRSVGCRCLAQNVNSVARHSIAKLSVGIRYLPRTEMDCEH